MIQLYIQSGDGLYEPEVSGAVKWETNRKGQPGKLTFSILETDLFNVQEGNAVRLEMDDKKIFYGFVFKKEYGTNEEIAITAYDQIRYLKNKDTRAYENLTASELIQSIADDFRLKTGLLEDTVFKIESRIEDNKSLMDMIQNALDMTLKNTNKLYVLYDDFGALSLSNIESLKLDLLISEDTAQDYKFTSSIDGETYNQIKLSYDNAATKKRDIYLFKDSKNINEWGALQYFESIDDVTNVSSLGDKLLSYYNRKLKTFDISGAFGDVRVRAGCSVPVILTLKDETLQNYLVVEKVTHTFEGNAHFMDLTLRGGMINA